MNISSVISSIKQMINGAKMPAQGLPAILLYATTLCRGGMSAMDIAANTIQEYGDIIPNGPNPDGSENLINAYTYILTKNIVESIKLNAVGEGTCAPGEIVFQGDGANGGGPVHVVGFNTNFPKIRIRLM